MPIYEYHCQTCGRRSAILVRSFLVAADPVCAHCGSRSVERLISRVAVLHSSQDLFQDYSRTSQLEDVPDDDEDEGGGLDEGDEDL